jgi:hypothetical protein
LDQGIIELKKFIYFRYKGSYKFFLVCESYATWEDNFVKVMEIARELYWEAIRAP